MQNGKPSLKIVSFDSPHEWGEPEKMDREFLLCLDAWLQFIRTTWLEVNYAVRFGTQGEHSPGSLHYQGKAADLIISMPADKRALDLLLTVARFNFTGVGLYPHWNNKTSSGITIPNHMGLHLERKGPIYNPGTQRLAQWLAYYHEQGGKKHQAYTALNAENIRRYSPRFA